MCWEPPLYDSPEAEERARIIEREEAEDRRHAEQRRCEVLRTRMEQAICKSFSGDELAHVQLYKDAIFGYLKNDAKYDLNDYEIEMFVVNLYRILSGKQVSTFTYCRLQTKSRTKENIFTRELIVRYHASDFLVETLAMQLNMSHSELIEMIDCYDGIELVRIKNAISELYKKEKSQDSIEPTADEMMTAVDTVKKLRAVPSLMGMSHDEMSKRIDKTLIFRKSR